MQHAESLADRANRNLADQGKNPRMDRMRGRKRAGRVQESCARHNTVRLGMASRDLRPQGHVRRALFVAGVNDPQLVPFSKAGIQEWIELNPRQAIERVETVRNQRIDGQFGD